MDELPELVSFVDHVQDEVRQVAMKNVAGLTHIKEAQDYFAANPGALLKIFGRTGDALEIVAHDAYAALINLSSESDVMAQALVSACGPGMLAVCMAHVCDPKCAFADLPCMLLSNITRVDAGAEKFLQAGGDGSEANAGAGKFLHAALRVLGRDDSFNPKAKFHWLATAVSNCSRLPFGKRLLLDHQRVVIQHLLPLLSHPSPVRRGGIAAALYNCSFDSQHHAWLLGDDVAILSYLLLPLIGPEEYADEEMEGMPDSLQYMDADKQREADSTIARLLVQTLSRLASTLAGRSILRKQRCYPIIRDFHNAVERAIKDGAKSDVNGRPVSLPAGASSPLAELRRLDSACFQLIELIEGEDEPGSEHLELVDLPENYVPEGGGIMRAPNNGEGGFIMPPAIMPAGE